jgi:hypothetical protein
MRRRAVLVGALAVAVLAAGCGGGDAASGGWAGGEPAWEGEAGGGDRAVADSAAGAAVAPEADVAAPAPALEGLRAGSVDDGADYAGFLEYLTRIESSGIATREFDAAGRVLVHVEGEDGLPLAGEPVEVRAGDEVVASLRTTADGSARFWPGLHGQAGVGRFVLSAAGETVEVAPGEEVTLTVDRAGGRQGPLALDVLFLLDATGSMGDEIDRLKTTIDSVAGRAAGLKGSPDARFGMTLYRDEGDTFVTSTFDLTADLDAFRLALSAVGADGGGDYPEALDEGLAEALSEPSWRDPAETVQLVFLVADAPPQVGRQVERGYPASVVEAAGRGAKVFPIASSESDDQAEAVFRQVAAGTGSRFVFLSYGAAGAATGASSDIASTDYEELSLDDLVVRLVAEELAALGGTEVQPEPSPSPSPSTPPDQ